jgi:hypothetical protein
MKPRLFFIQGAPSVGKSALMDLLKPDYPKGIFIEVDAIRKLRGKVEWDSHGEEYRYALETVAALVEFHRAKKEADPIFVIDCLSEKGHKTLVGYLKHPTDFRQIIIWAENQKLERRMKARKDHPFGNLEIALKMNTWLKDYSKIEDQKKIFFVDTTQKTLKESAEQLKCIIEKTHG